MINLYKNDYSDFERLMREDKIIIQTEFGHRFPASPPLLNFYKNSIF
jgi:hypothetical protein